MLVDLWLKYGKLNRIGPAFPTFVRIRPNGTSQATAPDILLCNRKAYHNFHHKKMPANCSDHLGVKITISTKPILKIIRREQMCKANWSSFSTNVANHTTPVNIRNERKEKLAESISEITKVIQDRSRKAVPKRIMVARPFLPLSPKFKRLTKILDIIHGRRMKSINLSVTIHLNEQRRKIIQQLNTEGARLAYEQWKNKILEIAKTRTKDPSTYWRQMKSLMGKGKKQTITITDTGEANGRKLTEDAEIEQDMRNEWTSHFTEVPRDRFH